MTRDPCLVAVVMKRTHQRSEALLRSRCAPEVRKMFYASRGCIGAQHSLHGRSAGTDLTLLPRGAKLAGISVIHFNQGSTYIPGLRTAAGSRRIQADKRHNRFLWFQVNKVSGRSDPIGS